MADINDRVALLEAEVRVLAARFYALPEAQKLLKAEADEAERVRKAQLKAEEDARRAEAKEAAAKEAMAEERRLHRRG